MVRVLTVLGAAALCVLLSMSPAHAQPAGAQAEVLFRQGRDLMAAGKTAEACEAFEQSQRLEPAVTTLINLAACREKNNQLASAWGLFLEAERQTRSGGDEASRQLHGVAQSRAQALEPRVSKLAINVADDRRIDGLEITRGRDVVQAAMWNRALPIDGGTYTISARAPGAAAWSTQVTVAPEGDDKTVDVPDLRTLPRDVPSDGPEVTVSTPPEPSEPTSGGSQLVPLALGAGAVALLGGALGFELWGRSTLDDARSELMDQARRDSLESSANTKHYVAQGMAVAGIACAGVAVWFYVRGRGEPASQTARSRELVVSPTGIALVGRF